MSPALQALRRTFGFDAFRGDQAAIVEQLVEMLRMIMVGAHVLAEGDSWFSIGSLNLPQGSDPDKVIAALPGTQAPNLTGSMSEMLPNHHITKPVLIGEIQADGQFEVVWQTEKEVPGDAWTDHLPESAKITADWQDPAINCGNYNTATKTCSGQNY